MMIKQQDLGLFAPLDRRLKGIAKADLHRHLSGSVRFSTLFELAQSIGEPLPFRSPDALAFGMTVRSPLTSLRAFVAPKNGHRPWNYLHRLVVSQEVARRLAFEAVEDAAADGISYLELRVSPYGLFDHLPITLPEFLRGLQDGLDQAFDLYQTQATIVLSLVRHTLLKFDAKVRERYYDELLSTALQFRERCVVGFDLAGAERGAPPQIFKEFFQEARKAGFGVTVHAGEGEPPENIRQAISVLGATRIGHGTSLLEDSKLVGHVIEAGITIEQCLTSNFITGVVSVPRQHPLPRLLDAGVNVILCTDNPSILNVTLTGEYQLAYLGLGITEDQLHLINNYAHAARFATVG